jgi:hypothetical protein
MTITELRTQLKELEIVPDRLDPSTLILCETANRILLAAAETTPEDELLGLYNQISASYITRA